MLEFHKHWVGGQTHTHIDGYLSSIKDPLYDAWLKTHSLWKCPLQSSNLLFISHSLTRYSTRDCMGLESPRKLHWWLNGVLLQHGKVFVMQASSQCAHAVFLLSWILYSSETQRAPMKVNGLRLVGSRQDWQRVASRRSDLQLNHRVSLKPPQPPRAGSDNV